MSNTICSIPLCSDKCLQDFTAFLSKDPACNYNPNILIQYTSYKAVLHYRIANHVLNNYQELEIAHAISNRGKFLSHAEIHPASTIGNNFIIDHGIGTVIGETTIIGNDCYILGGVILGAYGISSNQHKKRHPTIGNNVQIGTRAKILGNITIGDNVFIGADCCITENIPSNTKVVLENSHQSIKNNNFNELFA